MRQPPKLYFDSEHLSIAGGAVLTASFAQFLGLRDWSTEPFFVWHPGSQGVFKMKVNARQANSPNDTDHYREFTALW